MRCVLLEGFVVVAGEEEEEEEGVGQHMALAHHD
jgi:hypothetical protein